MTESEQGHSYSGTLSLTHLNCPPSLPHFSVTKTVKVALNVSQYQCHGTQRVTEQRCLKILISVLKAPAFLICVQCIVRPSLMLPISCMRVLIQTDKEK